MLTTIIAKRELDRAATAGNLTPSGSGRGIVICGGGVKYFTCAWVCINRLRSLGCQLPIELWFLGPAEVDSQMRSLLQPLGVRCVDALETRRRHPARILNGWELKPYSIIHCSFREVLFLDADNVPVVDPTFLFDTPEYLQHRAIFWPDYGRLDPERSIWQLTGVNYRDEPEFETGQIVIDKGACWRALNLTMWMNEHSDFWYQHIHGDKETFHMAWRKLQLHYAIPRFEIESLESTMCQHDFEGRRIFQHRNGAKWSVDGENRVVGGFICERECLEDLAKLRQVWCTRPTLPFQYGSADIESRQIAVDLCTRHWFYRRINSDQRPMRFSLDGHVAEGSRDYEQTWNIKRSGGEPRLTIAGAEGITCELRVAEKDTWRGRWQLGDFAQVELTPISSE
jgi:hypothetical protein